MHKIVDITLFKYIFSYSLALKNIVCYGSHTRKNCSFFICKREKLYKYVDLDMMMTNYIQIELEILINIQKTNAIGLLTKKKRFQWVRFVCKFQPLLLCRIIHHKIRSFFRLRCKGYLSEKRSVFNCSIGRYKKYARQNFLCYYQQSK